MSPHDENWDLEPENGHPNARLLLSEPFYWDSTDDNSPLGNDTGADVLSFYSEAVTDNPNTDPLKFLEELLGSSEMLIDDWEMTDPAKIRSQLKNDPESGYYRDLRRGGDRVGFRDACNPWSGRSPNPRHDGGPA